MDFYIVKKYRDYAKWALALAIALNFLAVGFIAGLYLTTSIFPYMLVIIFCVLVLTCLILAILGLRGPDRGRSKIAIGMSIFAAGFFGFVAPLAMHDLPAREKYSQMEKQLAAVCQDQVLSVNTTGININYPHILAVSSTDPFATANLIPEKYWPTQIEDVDLVLCVGRESEETIQTCSYSSDQTLKRIQYNLEVKLVDPTTTQVNAHGMLKGTEPESCPAVISERPTFPVKGNHPGSKETDAWLTEVLEFK